MKIAFYLNLHGSGHCRRFEAVARHLPEDFELAVMGMNKLPPIRNIDRRVIRIKLPGFGPNSDNAFVEQQTSHAYHDFKVNHGDNTAFTLAMVNFFSQWQPDLVVSDVGLEASVLARMCGLPVVYTRQHGTRWDKGHTLAYEWACSLWAPFATEMEQHDCPVWIRNKTFYSGGFSRFSGLEKPKHPPICYSEDKANILVMTGFGGTSITLGDIAAAAAANPQWRWHIAGLRPSTKLDKLPKNMICHGVIRDVWPYLCHADLVVANAGHNSVMEIAAAGRPFLCVPAARPFAEQQCKARVLRDLKLGVIRQRWPESTDWPDIFAQAAAQDLSLWEKLQDADAARRSADYLSQIARLCDRTSPDVLPSPPDLPAVKRKTGASAA